MNFPTGRPRLSIVVNNYNYAQYLPEALGTAIRQILGRPGDGGLILGVACNTAPDCKPENFRAFLDTGRTHAPRRRSRTQA
mgnify:CR=1 FL=1